MYGWLLIMYFKCFFFPLVLCFYPPGKTGYIIGEALWKMKIQSRLLKNLIRNLREQKQSIKPNAGAF